MAAAPPSEGRALWEVAASAAGRLRRPRSEVHEGRAVHAAQVQDGDLQDGVLGAYEARDGTMRAHLDQRSGVGAGQQYRPQHRHQQEFLQPPEYQSLDGAFAQHMNRPSRPDFYPGEPVLRPHQHYNLPHPEQFNQNPQQFYPPPLHPHFSHHEQHPYHPYFGKAYAQPSSLQRGTLQCTHILDLVEEIKHSIGDTSTVDSVRRMLDGNPDSSRAVGALLASLRIQSSVETCPGGLPPDPHRVLHIPHSLYTKWTNMRQRFGFANDSSFVMFAMARLQKDLDQYERRGASPGKKRRKAVHIVERKSESLSKSASQQESDPYEGTHSGSNENSLQDVE